MSKKTISVTTNEENPEPVELIASSIIGVAEAFEKINNSRLSRRAVILLLHDLIGPTKINKKQIELILDNAPLLKKYYIKDLPKKK